jgi:hypothetical protein
MGFVRRGCLCLVCVLYRERGFFHLPFCSNASLPLVEVGRERRDLKPSILHGVEHNSIIRIPASAFTRLDQLSVKSAGL